MYAVIRAGGKQFRVAPGDVIKIEKFDASEETFDFPAADVLMVSPEAGQLVKPNGKTATVSAQIVDEGRADKILVFKFKRKKQYKKMQGHRQDYTAVRILGIEFDGNRASVDAIKRAPKKSLLKDAAEMAGRAAGTVANVMEAASGKSSAKKKSARKAAGKTAAKKSSSKKK